MRPLLERKEREAVTASPRTGDNMNEVLEEGKIQQEEEEDDDEEG